MNIKQVEELVLQSLEHELGGVKVYATALTCALNPDLKEEWEEYLAQTKTHVTALEGVCAALGLDPRQETPGRKVVRHVGTALVEAMTLALGGGDPAAAELVACECVVLAETKDHADWQLLGKCADHLEGQAAVVLKEAYSTIEDQEDERILMVRCEPGPKAAFLKDGAELRLFVRGGNATAELKGVSVTDYVKQRFGA